MRSRNRLSITMWHFVAASATISKYFETTLSHSAVNCAQNQYNVDDSGCFLEFPKQRHMHWEMKWFLENMTWQDRVYVEHPEFRKFLGNSWDFLKFFCCWKLWKTRQSKQCGFSIYTFDNLKSKSMVRLVRGEKMVLSGLVFARKIARMILIQNI